jgi:hypothetical protein
MTYNIFMLPEAGCDDTPLLFADRLSQFFRQKWSAIVEY